MNRIIRVAVPKDMFYGRKALSGIKYMYKMNGGLKIEKVSVLHDDNVLDELTDGHIDVVITQYERLLECSGDIQKKIMVGLVFPQSDKRDVLVTMKKSRNHFDRAVVECYSSAACDYMEKMYDSIICRLEDDETYIVDSVMKERCDAAVLSADMLRSLRIDKNRHLNYVFFENIYDNLKSKAVWVAVIRQSDTQLSEMLMPMSDVDTLKKLT